MKKLLVVLSLCAISAQGADLYKNFSVGTFAAMRSVNITDDQDWGAGVEVGYKFNKYVAAKVRAISYSNEDWGGSVVDEGSALVEATLLRSAGGGVTLSAVGGADRDFNASDWGFSVGPRVSLGITKNLSLFGESRIRAWFKQQKDLITTAGISLSF